MSGGDSAFPIVVHLAMDGRVEAGGLTKRELFAAMIMQGSVAAESDLEMSHSDMASDCVRMADALLSELAKAQK